jgi:aryl-alcohol dehydrogenase-like predicted oxidoreductase
MTDGDDTLFVRERRELGNTGIQVSPIGFGASPLGNEFGRIDVCFLV